VAPGRSRGTSLQSVAPCFDSSPFGPGSFRGVGDVLQGRQGKVVKPIAQARANGSGSLGLPRSLPGLSPSPAGPSRISRGSRRSPTGAGARKPSWTCLPFKALENGGVRLAPPPSSRGIRRSRALPPTCLSRVNSRRSRSPSFGRAGTHRPILFRPRGSSPPRRFPPRGGRGSVAPRSRTRVRRVSRYTGARHPRPPEGGLWPGRSQWRSPRRGSHPSKSSLRRQPHRITAAVALPAVTVPPKRVDDSTR
jgi:hypothetical protein